MENLLHVYSSALPFAMWQKDLTGLVDIHVVTKKRFYA